MQNNNTVRVHGRLIDIPKRPNAWRRSYAKATVIVRHLLSGQYRVYYEGHCIAQAKGTPPTVSGQGSRTPLGYQRQKTPSGRMATTSKG